MKKIKALNIIMSCLTVLCFAVSVYLRSLKGKLPLSPEETQVILECNQIGIFLKNISIILLAVLFITMLMYFIGRDGMNNLKKVGTICGAIAFLLMPLASVFIIASWFHGWTVDKSDTVPAMSLAIISIMSVVILFLAVVDIVSLVFFIISIKKGIKALRIISEGIGLLSNLLFSGLYLFICHSSELYRTMTIIYFAVTAVLHIISLLSAFIPEKISN